MKPFVLILLIAAATSAAARAAPPDPNELDGVAALFGGFLAMSADCNLPTARVEAAFERYLTAKQVGPLEATRLRGVMMRGRTLFRGVGVSKGCDEARAMIDRELGD
jgi:hypothetical protein